MRHIDDAHDTKGNRQTNRRQHQNRTEAEPEKGGFQTSIETTLSFYTLHGGLCSLDNIFVTLILKQAGQGIKDVITDLTFQLRDGGKTFLCNITVQLEQGKRYPDLIQHIFIGLDRLLASQQS